MTKEFEKKLEEVLADTMFDCDVLAIGDVKVLKWAQLTPKYETITSEGVIAEGNDLFEVLRQTFK